MYIIDETDRHSWHNVSIPHEVLIKKEAFTAFDTEDYRIVLTFDYEIPEDSEADFEEGDPYDWDFDGNRFFCENYPPSMYSELFPDVTNAFF